MSELLRKQYEATIKENMALQTQLATAKQAGIDFNKGWDLAREGKPPDDLQDDMLSGWKCFMYDELLAKYRWIPVSEGLPETDEMVLCELRHCTTHGKKYAVLFKVDESDVTWRTADDNAEISYDWDVTHYRPITLPGDKE